MFQNMRRPQGAVTEVDHINQGEENGGQGRLREGPLRKLRKAELQLLEDLGLHEEKPLSLLSSRSYPDFWDGALSSLPPLFELRVLQHHIKRI